MIVVGHDAYGNLTFIMQLAIERRGWSAADLARLGIVRLQRAAARRRLLAAHRA
jgi:hypothetical protein